MDGQEDAQIVRSAYEAFNRGGPEAMLPYLDPEVEWDESDLPARRPGIYHGHDGFKKLVAENASLWNDIQIVVDDVIDAGDGNVVAFIRAKGRGKFTGVDVELATAQVWRLRNGQGTNVHLYLVREDALDAVGLR